MKRRILLSLCIVFALAANIYAARNARNKPLKIIQLPEPKLTSRTSLEKTIAQRRSTRNFSSEPLDFVQIGQLAWAGQGVTEEKKGLRTAPSAGALYPLQLYFVMPDGVYLYQPAQHSLKQIAQKDIRQPLAEAALGQDFVELAPCNIIIAGSRGKLLHQYRKNANRYMLLEAGHVAQNILLQTVSLELASVPVGAFEPARVRKLCRIEPGYDALYILCVGNAAQTAAPTAGRRDTAGMPKQALLIIAPDKFRDEELFETRRVLSQNGVRTVVASSRLGQIRGMLGARTTPDLSLNNINLDDYDAVIFIGGSGASEYFDDPLALNIARDAKAKDKILAAICIAPAILANAGVLKGTKVTSYPTQRSRLKEAGAVPVGGAVRKDKNIITARGPQAAVEFGRAIVAALEEKTDSQPATTSP